MNYEPSYESFGFVKAAACSPALSVADTDFNADEIIKNAREASENGARIIIFPELCVTGYTCSDLFLQETLLCSSVKSLKKIIDETKNLDSLVAVGLPLTDGNALFNVAAAFFHGQVLALVPKSYIPNYAEFYERRHFMPFSPNLNSNDEKNKIEFEDFGTGIFDGAKTGTNILIQDEKNPSLKIGFEICEDLWVPLSPSTNLALAGATVIANLSASNEIIGKASYRKTLVSAQSAKNISAYIYANAGNSESTTDLVFSGHSIIAENGTILAEKKPFEDKILYAEIDFERLSHERIRTTTFASCSENNFRSKSEMANEVRIIKIDLLRNGFALAKSNPCGNFSIERKITPFPFVPQDSVARKERCMEVVELQAQGLAKRLRHVNASSSVIGLSGGLDSTLALLVTCRAFDLCKIPREKIISVTMPGFGTTGRTYKNACLLAERTGSALREINISKAVLQHFKDIGQDENVHDVTYENSQARERTQILMDIANKTGGLVIGTGDLSEQALGWATYNGDHMSMYGVNGSIPKTLVRYLVQYFADEAAENGDEPLSNCLNDILATPVSPELLPAENGEIAQKTEDIVGPYVLHDFFLYYVLRFGFSPEKIFFLAEQAFIKQPEEEGKSIMFGDKEIKKWLKSFYKRFFAQQFKRSCMPDGAKVGSVNLSPRGDWRMPSDASAKIWIKEAENLR